ncbi:MAG: efflux RND transporter permease subunit [Chromatiales bacterium]|nr:efflux RND transporter permease subunit [Chromatiales bacterium]MDX9766177.1 efflux RND transporter permease subunit [Ectothiorhodospiraceae bacterium]
MLAALYRNHVLANLTFALVLIIGFLAFGLMPREQDPTINFNWIDITTVVPGASAQDVERRVTDVLEDAVRKVQDIKFVSSNSREGISSILVRFKETDERTFDKRVTDLRREIQTKRDELPPEAEDPRVIEITTANAFPTAVLVIVGQDDDEHLRRQGEVVMKAVERITGVDIVFDFALHDPELQVHFDPQRLEETALAPTLLADTVGRAWRDTSAGSARVNDQSWLVRLIGAEADPSRLAALPVATPIGEVRLDALAEVVRGRQKPVRLVRHEGRPAIMLSITKQPNANTIELVKRIDAFVNERNRLKEATGVELKLVDDQTEITRSALAVMQNNALIGLLLVLLVAWAFLGGRIAILTAIGIPFVLAGTFLLLHGIGITLNVMVLMGVVISLGMLVDDAVVVVEGIYYRLQRGMDGMRAATEALREVFAPVTSAVLTTLAAFLPLMLLPGILGQFMFLVPFVVSTALTLSLLQAYWMLPTHVLAARVSFRHDNRMHRWRERWLHRIRIGYTRFLVKALRRPRSVLAGMFLLFALALGAVAAGLVRMDFFAFDPIRLYYVNVEMPIGTPLDRTMNTVQEVERRVRAHAREGEVRGIVGYAGNMFTDTAPFQGDHYGQVLVSLNPRGPGLREVDEMIEAMREDVTAVPGPARVFFQRIAGGPPTSKPIQIKVRGDELAQIRAAAGAIKTMLRDMDAVFDIADDDSPGQMELVTRVNQDAARRAGIDPTQIARTLRLYVDGEVVASMQDQGEKLDIRVRARPQALQSLQDFLHHTLPTADGGRIPLAELLDVETARGPGNIRHYNFRRTITVEADIDRAKTDTLKANRAVQAAWEDIKTNYPDIELDFTGELDDIEESLDAIGVLFLVGLGLMYLILGTQFRSYWQPFMILLTVPMAFTGVVMGLLITNNPLSLFTLYGVVALAGIAVNSAIVLISAANDRLERGMSVLHAILYAARRRVIPILITALTTIAGLFSLATGLGGHSLMWGPVATAIVWGLLVSTVLTLFAVPVLYRMSMGAAARRRQTAAI